MYIFKSVFKNLFSTLEFYIFISTLILLSALGFSNYLLFHSFAEGYVILISLSLFILNWNIRHIHSNAFLLHLSIGFFFVGIIDTFHLFSYKGIGIFNFTNPANPPTQFWIAARYLQALSFIIPGFFPQLNRIPNWSWGIFGTYTAISIAGIFLGIYPDCKLPITGLTPFKIYSEYFIAALFILGSYIVIVNRDLSSLRSRLILSTSLILMAIGEIFFTLYIDVYDIFNQIGHIFKIIAFYLVYKSTIQANLTSPIYFLFKNLENEKNFLKNHNNGLQDQLISYVHNLNFYKYALDQSSLIAITDRNGVIEYANELFVKTSKYSLGELIGQTHRLINSSHHPPEFFKQMWEEILKGNTWQGEVKNRAKDGTYYWVWAQIIPYRSPKGDIERFIAIRHDITEIKGQREKLFNANKMIALGELSGKVLHDTMNPLAIISGSVSIIEKSIAKNDTEKIHKSIDKINISVKRIQDLFSSLRSNILKPSEAEAGACRADEVFSLSEVINQAIFYYTEDQRFTNDGLRVSNNVDVNMQFKGCKFQITQVFVNMIVNARDAIITLPEKWIQIEAEALPNEIVIRITDSGNGIPKEIADKIFDALFTTKKNSGGTGLGLDICKGIIIDHKGTIEVNHASPNTQFIIRFPTLEKNQ